MAGVFLKHLWNHVVWMLQATAPYHYREEMLVLILFFFFFASPPGRRALVNRTIGFLLTIWWETLVFQDSFPLPVSANPLCSSEHQIHCCSHPNALMSTGANRIICCNQVDLSVGDQTPFRGLWFAERQWEFCAELGQHGWSLTSNARGSFSSLCGEHHLYSCKPLGIWSFRRWQRGWGKGL